MTVHSFRPLIAIGICTRQRNTLLRFLLESIWAQPKPPDYDVEIIIVDNNDTPTVAPEIADLSPKFKLTVTHESKAGLVNARNRVLEIAESIDADWLIGIDDDEYVEPDWLAQFIRGFKTLDADIIVAARRIIYGPETSPYVNRLKHEQLPAGEESKILSTANFAVSKRIFHSKRGLGLRFHPCLNESGGEDYEFLSRARIAHGIIPVKWPFAISTENFDGKRAEFRYQFRRRLLDQLTRYRVATLHRRTGVQGTRTGNAAKLFQKTIRYIVYGSAECISGGVQFLLGRKYARQVVGGGLLKWARALAVIPYFMGRSAVHYGASVNADRAANEKLGRD